jgi:hypothetical protein
MPNGRLAIVRDAERRRRRRLQQGHAAPLDRRSRPERWRDAINELLALQAAYADWLAALPDSLSDSATAEALEAIVDLDLIAIADCQPPRGYGRD